MKRKNVLYVRLSVSDSDRDEGENSESIDNQIDYIKEYCEKKNIEIGDYYIDDGYSGGNFERPQFRRLVSDIEKNLVSLILVKDISRLGRDFLEVSYYINQYFPSHDVCFISINDNYDSSDMSGNYVDTILNIKSFVNEKYLRDISKKIKQVKLQKTTEINYLGIVAPYGYIRVVRNGRNTLDIDKDTCNIVKRIFLDVACGKTLSNVATDLNNDNIISPSVYMGMHNYKGKWTAAIIYRIIRNVVYSGSMYYRKSEKSNYKMEKREHICLRDRKVINETHPAIVSKELFDLANGKIRFNNKKVKCSYESFFLGKICCGMCGQSCKLSKKQNSCGKTQYFFYCPNYRICCNKTVSECKLKAQVINVLGDVVLKKIDADKVVTAIVDDGYYGRKFEYKLQKIKECINHYSVVLQGLYLKLASEKIDVLEFQREKMCLSRQKENSMRELQVLQNENIRNIYAKEIRKNFTDFICESDFLEKHFNNFVDRVIFYKDGKVEINFLFSNRQQMEIRTI